MTGGQFISGVKIFRDNVTTAPQTVSVSQAQLQLPSIRNKTRIIRVRNSAWPVGTDAARTDAQTDGQSTNILYPATQLAFQPTTTTTTTSSSTTTVNYLRVSSTNTEHILHHSKGSC